MARKSSEGQEQFAPEVLVEDAPAATEQPKGPVPVRREETPTGVIIEDF